MCSYETEILKRIAEENLEEEGDRGLAVYLDDPKLEEKIYSMKPTVEVWRGELWGVLEVESLNQLSEREIEAVKEYWEGQESDGWGEGFEQRGIKIPEGELYVSFWNSGDEFSDHRRRFERRRAGTSRSERRDCFWSIMMENFIPFDCSVP